MSVSRPLLASALALPLLLTGACSAGHTAAASGAPAASASTEAATTTGGVQVLTVTGTAQLEFLQTHLSARAGIPIRIEFTVVGGVPHNFALLDGPKLATPVISSGTTSLTMTLPAGVYHFQCTIHPATMNGTLTVH